MSEPHDVAPQEPDAVEHTAPVGGPAGTPQASPDQAPTWDYSTWTRPIPPAPQVPSPARTPPLSRPSGWVWPVVAAIALLVGFVGGALAGGLVAGSGGDGSGGVLKVQRRTAAPLPAANNSIAAVASKVLPSTVQIVAEYKGDDQGATGSGWVFDKQGHIITNNHVVADAANDHGPIEVIDQKGRHLKAEVIGRSSVYDIAVLKAPGARRLTPAAIGSADQMRVGETVIAIGSPLGLSATVTSGIISAMDRPVTTGDGTDSSYINAVQTDAAINPGNSGGPLCNLQGQVVGVNSAIASLGSTNSSGESGNIGVGFAIPIEQVQVTTDQILRTGRAQYPVIGASIQGTKDRAGARVESVEGGAPAQKAGLRSGDVITAIDGKQISGSIDLVVAIRTHVPGDTVALTVHRGTGTRTIRVRLNAKTG